MRQRWSTSRASSASGKRCEGSCCAPSWRAVPPLRRNASFWSAPARAPAGRASSSLWTAGSRAGADEDARVCFRWPEQVICLRSQRLKNASRSPILGGAIMPYTARYSVAVLGLALAGCAAQPAAETIPAIPETIPLVEAPIVMEDSLIMENAPELIPCSIENSSSLGAVLAEADIPLDLLTPLTSE